MSGHSKWHSIKHAKGAADAARGKLFARLARQIEVAARDGGGDIEGNPTLRTMVQKARDASMPKDNIERAIKRGTGELEGVTYESVTYEGYATNGVAVYAECLTDNRNRTGAEIKNIFTRNGGSLAEPGAVAWQFERTGVVVLDKASAAEDDLMLLVLEAGADDIADLGDSWQVTTPPTDLHAVRAALDDAGIAVASADLTMLPTTTVALRDASSAKSVLRVIDALEEHDDVQNVYANFDIPDESLQLCPCERYGARMATAAIYTRIARTTPTDGLGSTVRSSYRRDLADRESPRRRRWCSSTTTSPRSTGSAGQRSRSWSTSSRPATVDTVVCYHADRLYRRASDLERLVTVVEVEPARRCRLSRPGTVDLASASGRMVARMLGAPRSTRASG